jgi:hypothetical protein
MAVAGADGSDIAYTSNFGGRRHLRSPRNAYIAVGVPTPASNAAIAHDHANVAIAGGEVETSTTVVAAEVIVDVVSVVALFKAIQPTIEIGAVKAVSAARHSATLNAFIIIAPVAVVAGLKAGFAFVKIETLNTVTAARRHAAFRAAIIVGEISVVAGLKAGFAFVKIETLNTITA